MRWLDMCIKSLCDFCSAGRTKDGVGPSLDVETWLNLLWVVLNAVDARSSSSSSFKNDSSCVDGSRLIPSRGVRVPDVTVSSVTGRDFISVDEAEGTLLLTSSRLKIASISLSAVGVYSVPSLLIGSDVMDSSLDGDFPNLDSLNRSSVGEAWAITCGLFPERLLHSICFCWDRKTPFNFIIRKKIWLWK